MKTKNIETLGLSVAAACLITTTQAATVIGLNFARDGGGQTTGTADGVNQSNWTDVYDSDGFDGTQNKTLNGSAGTVGASWIATNSWWAGSGSDSEKRIYACYLDDGGTGDGIGVRVTITGLASWLSAEGQTSYQIRTYVSTDSTAATFQTITIHDGSATGVSLGTISPVVLGGNDFPTDSSPNINNPRGYADSIDTLNADTITLTIPQRDGSTRGTLAALKFTAIPEPSAALLGGLSIFAMLRRRRKTLSIGGKI